MLVRLFFIFIILYSNILLAYDMDQMLDLYRKNSDLSEKTKDESLGHLTVYTRDDIERMQAHNLSELLNSQRSFRYNENLLGMPDVLHSDPAVYSSGVVKIFINNHEITSAFAGSGLFIYGNIDLGFVDHVEIYEGSTSSSVSTEPAIVTIKLYSKDPAREAGTNIQGYVASRGSHHENISHSGVSNDLKYYVYVSNTNNNRTEYQHDNHTLSRDNKNVHALATIDYKNIKIGAEYIDHKLDSFLSLSVFATPKQSDIKYDLQRLSSTITFLDDDSLKLSLSFVRINEYLNFNTDGTIRRTGPPNIFLPTDSLHSKDTDDVYNVKLEKELTYNKNNLIFGAEYMKKHLHDTVSYSNGVLDTTPVFVDNSIYSLYAQDDYMLFENQIITASFKHNRYENKSDADQKTFSTNQIRLGYIATSQTSMFKVFVSEMELPTEQAVLTSVDNARIEILRIRDLSLEYNKHIGNNLFGVSLEYLQNENSTLVLSRNNTTKRYYDNYSGSLTYDYKFDGFNKFHSMFYLNQYYNPANLEQETVEGANFRLLNSWKKFDFYNEANYYHIRDTQVKGINYNLGVRYKVTSTLVFSMKGKNIFDSAAKSKYDYLHMNGFTPEIKSFYISPIDRTVTLGMEYTF